METVIQNANADLTALKTKVDEIKQIIENLDNLYVMYSNSLDFGSYDYLGNPNLMRVIKASDFINSSDVSVSDVGYNSIRLTSQGVDRLSAFTANNIPSLISGKTYTISVKLKIEEGTTGDINKVRVTYRKANSGTILLYARSDGAEVGKEITIKGTATVNYEITDVTRFYLAIDTDAGAKINGSVIVSDIKIEEGSTATPYQPNLLDDPYWIGKAPLGENIADPTTVFPISTSNYLLYNKRNIENYEVGKTYTLTMKATKPATQSFTVFIMSGTQLVGTMTPVEGKIDEWKLTFTVSQGAIDAGATNILQVYQYPNTSLGAVQIDWLKIEKGDTRTPNISEYKYRGTGMRDSNNPYDYVWDIEPSYVENNLATDIKVAEITGKANNYTDGKVAQVNSNLLTVINTLEKRVSTNSNNILDNTTKIGANTSSINTIRKSMPLFAVYGEGTDLSDVPTGTKLPIGALIATDFAHTASDLPYTISSDGNTLTATRNCVLLFEGSVKIHGNNTIKYAYVKIRKNGSDTNFANVGSSAALNYMTAQAGQYVHTLVTGDKVEFTVALDTAGKLFHTQLLSLKISEIKPV
ncbi:TPA: hypothetical protein ACH6KR_000565 [Enterococcus faecium]